MTTAPEQPAQAGPAWLTQAPPNAVMGLVVGPTIAQALDARLALYGLAAVRPDVDWVLLGPKALFCLFEMDALAAAHIPLLAAEPLRQGQPRLGRWWQVRRQHRKLATLAWHGVIAPVLQQQPVVEPAGWLTRLLKALHPVPVHNYSAELAPHPAPPVLQAGASALAWATRLMRQADPRDAKVLTFWPGVNALAAAHRSGVVPGQQAGEFQVHAVWRDPVQPVLQARQARALAEQTGVRCELVDLPQALGLLAYADRVKAHCPNIPRICAEMGRQDRLLLA